MRKGERERQACKECKERPPGLIFGRQNFLTSDVGSAVPHQRGTERSFSRTRERKAKKKKYFHSGKAPILRSIVGGKKIRLVARHSSAANQSAPRARHPSWRSLSSSRRGSSADIRFGRNFNWRLKKYSRNFGATDYPKFATRTFRQLFWWARRRNLQMRCINSMSNSFKSGATLKSFHLRPNFRVKLRYNEAFCHPENLPSIIRQKAPSE